MIWLRDLERHQHPKWQRREMVEVVIAKDCGADASFIRSCRNRNRYITSSSDKLQVVRQPRSSVPKDLHTVRVWLRLACGCPHRPDMEEVEMLLRLHSGKVCGCRSKLAAPRVHGRFQVRHFSHDVSRQLPGRHASRSPSIRVIDFCIKISENPSIVHGKRHWSTICDALGLSYGRNKHLTPSKAPVIRVRSAIVHASLSEQQYA